MDFWPPLGASHEKMKDYKSARIPMLPVKVGLTKASQIVFFLNAVTVAFSFLMPLFGLTGAIYLGFAVLAGGDFFFKIEAYYFHL
jgi:heme O synthase-like polyprenyltransferase